MQMIPPKTHTNTHTRTWYQQASDIVTGVQSAPDTSHNRILRVPVSLLSCPDCTSLRHVTGQLAGCTVVTKEQQAVESAVLATAKTNIHPQPHQAYHSQLLPLQQQMCGHPKVMWWWCHRHCQTSGLLRPALGDATPIDIASTSPSPWVKYRLVKLRNG